MKGICLLALIHFGFVPALMAQNDTVPAHLYRLSQLPVLQDSSRLRVQLMNGSTALLDKLEAHLTILLPGQAAHPPHTHTSTEELLIVKEGQLTVTINGKQKTLLPGGLALALPGDLHAAVNKGNTTTSYYVIKYTAARVNAARGKDSGGAVVMNWTEPAVTATDRGERRQFFNRPTALLEKFDMHATTLNKGEVSHLPHTHRQEEIIIVREGNITMQIGDKFYPAVPGDLVFLSSGVPHALQNTGNTATTYFAFQWQ